MKKIYSFCFIILLVLSFQNKAHSQNKFQIDYYSNFSAMDMDIFSGVKKSSTGYAMAGMVNGISLPLIQSILIATDTGGTVTWAKKIKDGAFLSFKNLYVSDLQTTSSGGYVMTGSFNDTYAMLLKVDGSGNSVFSYKYGASPNEFGNAVKELSASGGYIVAGTTLGKSMNTAKDSTSIYIFKTSSTGAYQWGRSYTLTSPVFDSQDEVLDVVEVPTGYVFAGYNSQHNGVDTTTNILVFKTDVNGTLQWMKSYGDLSSNEGAYSIKLLSNGDLLVGGYTDKVGLANSIAVLELDGSGNLVSSHAYGVGGLADMLGSIQQTTSGGFAIVGWTIGLTYKSFLMTLNSSYTPISTRTYNNFIGGLFTKGEQVPGGYVIGSMIGTTGYQLHMIKTDANGSSGSSCTESTVTPISYSYTPTVATITPTVYTGGSGSTYTVSLTSVTPTSTVECITLPLVVSAGPDKTICRGSSTTIGGAPTANYGSTPYTYAWSPALGLSATNVANPTANPTNTTTYTVTVTDGGGATGSDVVIVNVNPLPTATASNSGPVCVGGTLSLTGGAAGMTSYTWAGPNGFSNSTQSPTVSASATSAMAGTYTLTVSNGTCTNTATTTVVVNALPTATATNNGPVCIGGVLTLTGGANGMTSYQWAGPSGYSNLTTQSPTVSASATLAMAGTYTVTVSNGTCSNTATTTVVVNSLPTATASSNSPVCLGSSLTLAGGANGMTSYTWAGPNGYSNSTQNPTVSPAATLAMAGTYTVTVANGTCTNTATTIVIVNSLPTATASNSGPVCVGGTLTLAGGAGGMTSYTWAGPNSYTSTSQNPTVSASATLAMAGTYTVTVANGTCTNTATTTVVVNTLPTATASNNGPVCIGGPLTLTGGAGGMVSYNWTGPNSFSSTTQNPSVSASATSAMAGLYTLTISNGTCTNTSTTTVTVNTLPTASISGSTTICAKDSTTLTASGGGTYLWSYNGLTTAAITVKPIVNTTYTVTVTSGTTGCSNTANATVTINALPNPGLQATAGTCIGHNVVLTSAGGFSSYAWSPSLYLNATNVQNPVFTPGSPTTYTLTVTDANGCSNTASIYVDVYSAPPANAGVDTSMCVGSSIQLVATGGIGYAWSPGAGLSATNVANPTATPSGTSTYTVTVTDVAGCSATDNIVITVNPLPTPNAGSNQTICPGSTANLNATGGLIYVWSPGASLSDPGIANPVASPNTTTTYIVTATDVHGCSNTDNVTITVNIPTADAGPDVSICRGQTTTLGATGGTIYSWSPDSTLNNASIAAPIATPHVTTTYTVLVTNSNNCTATDNVTVTVHPLPTANAGQDVSICHGTSTNLLATGGLTYTWGPSTGLNSTTIAGPVASPNLTTTYTVTVTDGNGCTNSDNITVAIIAAPVANAGIDQSICLGESATLIATGGGAYTWNTGDTSSTVSYVPSVTTSYVVTVSYSNGCSSSDDVTITVNTAPVVVLSSDPTGYAYVGQIVTFTALPAGYSNYNFYIDTTLAQSGNSNIFVTNSLENGQVVSVLVTEAGCNSEQDTLLIDIKPIPNAFTPYEIDGKNDIFVKGLDIKIINRWGQKLYEGTEGWDGTFNGKLVSAGTYYYIIHINDMQGVAKELKGSVTVVQ